MQEFCGSDNQSVDEWLSEDQPKDKNPSVGQWADEYSAEGQTANMYQQANESQPTDGHLIN